MDKGWRLAETNVGKGCFRRIVERLEGHGKCLDFSFLSESFEQRRGLVNLCFWTSVDRWEVLMPKATYCRPSSLRRLLLLWGALRVPLCEGFERKAMFSRSAGSFFFLGDLGRYKLHSSFPSLALLSQDADEIQGESLKDEVPSGSPAAESQVGWFPFISLPCCLVFKALTCLFFFLSVRGCGANRFNIGSSVQDALLQKIGLQWWPSPPHGGFLPINSCLWPTSRLALCWLLRESRMSDGILAPKNKQIPLGV